MKTAGLEQVVSTAAQHVQTALQQGEHIPSLLCTRVVGSKRACIPPKRHFVSLTHSLAPPSACLLYALLSSLLMCAPALSLLLCAHLCTPPNTAVSFTAHRGATICAARAGEVSSRSPRAADVNIRRVQLTTPQLGAGRGGTDLPTPRARNPSRASRICASVTL